jgi:group I intron endonuclease
MNLDLDIFYGTRYVYKLTHIPTQKIYIGQTKNIKQRFEQHKSQLLKGTHNNKAMQRDFNKYGGDFTIEVLETIRNATVHSTSPDELKWIVYTGSFLPENGYNGCDPCVRERHSNEYTPRMKKMLSIANLVKEEKYERNRV